MTETTERECQYPGCHRPAAPAAGPGRAPSYCANPEHTRTTAFAARRRLAVEVAAEEDAQDQSHGVSYMHLSERVGSSVQRFAETAEEMNTLSVQITQDLQQLHNTEALTSEISAVRAEASATLAASTAQISTLEHTLHQVRTELTQLHAALEGEKKHSSQLRDQNAALQQELDGALAHSAELQNSITEYEKQLDATQEECGRESALREQTERELSTVQQSLAGAEKRAQRAQEAAEQHHAAAKESRQLATTAQEHAVTERRRAEEVEAHAAREREQAARERDKLVEKQQHTEQARSAVEKELAATRAEREKLSHSHTEAMNHAEQRLHDQRADLESRFTEIRDELRADRDAARTEAQKAREELAILRALNDATNTET